MRIGFLSFLCIAALTLAVPPAFAQGSRPAPARRGTSYLGIGVLEVNPDRAKALNLNEIRGVEVDRVDTDGPAAKAGLKEGDVVLQYNEQPVEGVEQFIRMVRETPVGRQVRMVVWRNGARQTLMVTVGERAGPPSPVPGPGGFPGFPSFPSLPQFEIPRPQIAWQNPLLGIEGESLGEERQLAQFFGVQDGVLVKQVLRNSAAEKAGLKAGDVITTVNGSPVSSTRDITSQLRSARSKSVSLTLMRDRKELTLSVTVADRSGNPPPAGDRF